MNMHDALISFLIGLTVLIVVIAVIKLYVNFGDWQVRVQGRVTVLDAAKNPKKVEYKVSVYRQDRGALVEGEYVRSLDSVFKVAQYAPDNFDCWDGGWNYVPYGLSSEGACEYNRKYISHDEQTYVIIVRTADGFWPISAQQYLGHL